MYKIGSLAIAAIAALLAQGTFAAEQKAPERPGPEVFFERLDRNHDGFISEDELPSFLKERQGEALKKADKNDDKKLDKAEFAELGKQLPGPGRGPMAGGFGGFGGGPMGGGFGGFGGGGPMPGRGGGFGMGPWGAGGWQRGPQRLGQDRLHRLLRQVRSAGRRTGGGEGTVPTLGPGQGRQVES